MLHLAPDMVDMSKAEDDPDRTVGKCFSYPVAQTSLQGLTGNPTEGTAEAGEQLFNQMGDALAEILTAAKVEQPPLP